MDPDYTMCEFLIVDGINLDLTADWIDEVECTGTVPDDLRARAEDASRWFEDLYTEHRETLPNAVRRVWFCR